MAVAAACFRAKLAGQPIPAGERTARGLAGYRRTAGDCGRGQARPFGVSNLAAVLATGPPAAAAQRGRLDAVIAGLLFMAGMRRSEVSALRWADVVESTDGDGMLVTVRRSKTNPEGEVNDVRFVKDGVARAIRTLRTATNPDPGSCVRPRATPPSHSDAIRPAPPMSPSSTTPATSPLLDTLRGFPDGFGGVGLHHQVRSAGRPQTAGQRMVVRVPPFHHPK